MINKMDMTMIKLEGAKKYIFSWIYVLFVILSSFVFVELYFEHNALKMDRSVIVINLLIYISIFGLIYAILNNIKISIYVYLVFWWFLSLIDHYVYRFRGNPLLAADLYSFKTAADVAGGYDYSPDKISVIITLLFLIVIIVTILIPLNDVLIDCKRYIVISLAIIPAIICVFFYFYSGKPEKWGINIHNVYYRDVYEIYGTATAFTMSVKELSLPKPEGYSKAELEMITKDYISDESFNNNVNIIAIVDESFSDLGSLGSLETSEDYMPFLHSLSENTVSGKLVASIWGGNTCNSEFEFLTGNTMGFQPLSSIAFQSIKSKIPSLVHTLKADGYKLCNAYHPAPGGNWNRTTVYPCLGFNSFIDEADFNESEKIRDFVTDREIFNRIIKDFEEGISRGEDPVFLYTMTMQNHGGYDQEWVKLPEEITILDDNAKDRELAQYINLIKQSDKAMEELTDYFDKHNDNKVVIVYFGDHQPRLSDEVYNNIIGDSSGRKYEVPFYIWANYDIEEKSDIKMSINYLSSYLLELTENGMTGYNKYLLELNKKLPVISAAGYKDQDNNSYSFEDKNTPYYEEIQNYRNLQYANMYDDIDNYKNFYFIKEK